MLGFNGGLLGVRKVPTQESASGLWALNEQSMAKRAGIWPILGPGGGPMPTLWYDFADESTVTVASSQITAVTSKGTRAWTLTKSTTGPGYVTGINSLKCLDWGASAAHSNYMFNSSSTSTTIGEVYVVVDASFGGIIGDSGYAGLFTSYTNAWYVLGAGGALTQSSTGFNSAYINGGASNRFSDLFSSPSIDNPAIIQINNSSGNTFNTTGGFEIGNDRGNWGLYRGWSGLVGEYIVYSSALSSDQRNLVVNYLAAKWNIST